jgi:hypothetical protein
MSWIHRLLGKDGTTQLGIESTHFAARVSGRPMQLGARGAYALGGVSGIMAAGQGANSEIVQMRWIDATRKMLLRSVTVSMAPGATAFAAGVIEMNLTIARGWTGDGTGTNAIVFSTNNTNKKRTDFPLSLFSDTGVRIASTAALGAGTKQLDTNRMASVSGYVSSVATTAASGPQLIPNTILWQRNTHDEYPILFEQNEGLVIRATVPATGTWQFSVGVEWAEIDTADVEGWA